MAALTRYLRHPRWDLLAIGLSMGHGLALLLWPSIPLIALAMWWNANTVSHLFIHQPFFRSRSANRWYAAYLSVLLGVPHHLFRRRHLEHHAESASPSSSLRRCGAARRLDDDASRIQMALIAIAWVSIVWAAPKLFVFVYLPGWALGLGLCQLHGYYEHAGGTTSYYGRVYNWLFFNDGLHVEHHARPSVHWSHLRRRGPETRVSRWPPVLRWLDALSLTGLEHLVLRSRLLQRVMLRTHDRTFRRVLPDLADVRRVVAVGGGLFPRTPLLIRDLLPDAHVTVVDSDSVHLELARQHLQTSHQDDRSIAVPDERIEWVHGAFSDSRAKDADLVIVPLAYVGDREFLYRACPAPRLIVYDWIWRRRGRSLVVAWWLLKRMNLIERAAESTATHRPAA